MTPEEAIEFLKKEALAEECIIEHRRELGGDISSNVTRKQALDLGVEALKKIQQYELIKNATIEEIVEALNEFSKIGTVEECREAMEKQKAMKPKEILRHRGGFEIQHCPNCNMDYQVDMRYEITDGYCPVCGKLLDSGFSNFCGNCGQALRMDGEDD